MFYIILDAKLTSIKKSGEKIETAVAGPDEPSVESFSETSVQERLLGRNVERPPTIFTGKVGVSRVGQ